MTDKNGNIVNVGDRVYVLPSSKGPDVASGAGRVRRLSADERGLKCRVDNGPAEMGPDLPANGPWTWSAWVRSNQFEKL